MRDAASQSSRRCVCKLRRLRAGPSTQITGRGPRITRLTRNEPDLTTNLCKHRLPAPKLRSRVFSFAHPASSLPSSPCASSCRYCSGRAPRCCWKSGPTSRISGGTHGFLIPAISLWLLFERRERIATTPVRPSLLGFVLLAAGCLLWLVLVRASLRDPHAIILPGILMWPPCWRCSALGLRGLSSFRLRSSGSLRRSASCSSHSLCRPSRSMPST